MSEIHARILRRAKKYYKKIKDFGVCYSVLETCKDSENKESKQILKWLDKTVSNRYGYYEDWMRRKHPKIYNNMSESDFVKARCKWIDWMIANNHIFDNIKVK